MYAAVGPEIDHLLLGGTATEILAQPESPVTVPGEQESACIGLRRRFFAFLRHLGRQRDLDRGLRAALGKLHPHLLRLAGIRIDLLDRRTGGNLKGLAVFQRHQLVRCQRVAVAVFSLFIQFAVGQPDPPDRLLVDPDLRQRIGGIGIDQRRSGDMHGAVDIRRVESVMDPGIYLGRLIRKGERRVGAIACEHIAPAVIDIAGGIILIGELRHLGDDRRQIRGGEILVRALVGLGDRTGEELRHSGERILRHLEPALGVLGILLIVLGQFGDIAAQTQRPDRDDRILRTAVDLLVGRHLGRILVFLDLILIDVVHLVVLHDLVRDAHALSSSKNAGLYGICPRYTPVCVISRS